MNDAAKRSWLLVVAVTVFLGADLFSAAGTAKPPVVPKVVSVSPRVGPAAGGTAVVVKGRGFTRRAVVYFGKARAATTFVSKRKLVAVAPASHPATVKVRVKQGGRFSKPARPARFTYEAMLQPTVTVSIAGPARASVGDVIAFHGTLATGAPGSQVTLEQQNSDGRWLPVGTTAPDAAGNFDVQHAPLAGQWRYRAVTLASGRYLAAISAPVIVDVSGPAQVVVDVLNVPPGTSPVIAVSSPAGDQLITGSTTYVPAKPGTWRVLAEPISVSQGQWHAQEPDQEVDVERGQSVRLTVDYSVQLAENVAVLPPRAEFSASAINADTFDLVFDTSTSPAAVKAGGRRGATLKAALTRGGSSWLPRSCPKVGDHIALPPADAAGLFNGALGTITRIDCTFWGVDQYLVVNSIRVQRDPDLTYAQLIKTGRLPQQQLMLDSSDLVVGAEFAPPIDAATVRERALGKVEVKPTKRASSTGCEGAAGVSLSGSFEVTPSLTVSAEWQFLSLKQITIRGELNQRSHIGVSFDAEASCTTRQDLWDLRFAPFVLQVAAVPIVITPVLDVNLDAGITATGTASFGVEQQLSTWAQATWTPGSGFVPTSGGEPASLEPTTAFDAEIEGHAAVTANLSFNINGVDGPLLYAKGEVGARAVATPGDAAPFAWSLTPEVSIGGRFRLKILGVGIESEDLEFWQHRWGPFGTLGLRIVTAVLPDAVVGQAYDTTLMTEDNRNGVWSVESGEMAPGLTLDDVGRISGIPTGAAADHDFTVRFTDNLGNSTTRALRITTKSPLPTHENIVMVSVSSAGQPANADSGHPAASADGQVVAFESVADNLVAGDTNQTHDIFVRDLSQGTTTRVSVATGGAQADGGSARPGVSPNGRYVAFWSTARNLAPGDDDYLPDVYLHDRVTGKTERISVATDGSALRWERPQGFLLPGRPAVDDLGRHVAFERPVTTSVPGGEVAVSTQVHVRDVMNETTTTISDIRVGEHPIQGGTRPQISADGTLVSFAGLVPDNGCAGCLAATETYLYDTATSASEWLASGSAPDLIDGGHAVALRSEGATVVLDASTGAELDRLPAPDGAMVGAIAENGRFALYETTSSSGYAFSLHRFDRVVRDMTEIVRDVGSGPDGSGGGWRGYAVSNDGRFVTVASDRAASGDQPGLSAVYRHDLRG